MYIFMRHELQEKISIFRETFSHIRENFEFQIEPQLHIGRIEMSRKFYCTIVGFNNTFFVCVGFQRGVGRISSRDDLHIVPLFKKRTRTGPRRIITFFCNQVFERIRRKLKTQAANFSRKSFGPLSKYTCLWFWILSFRNSSRMIMWNCTVNLVPLEVVFE